MHRRGAFAAGGISADPLHWWNLDNLTSGDGIDDKGSGAWGDLFASGGMAVSSGTGPGGKDVLDFTAYNDNLSGGSQAWDGSVQNRISVSCWAKMDAMNPSFGNWIINWRALSNPLITQVLLSNQSPDKILGTVWDSAGDQVSTVTTFTPATDTWYHIVIT